MIYIPKYLKAYELVDKTLYEALGDEVFKLFDSGLLMDHDTLREKYGAITVNTWYNGGSLSWRGYRHKYCDIFSETSTHSFGKGIDSNYANASAEEIRQDIKEGRTKLKYIKRIEDGVSWLHSDTKDVGLTGIHFFNP